MILLIVARYGSVLLRAIWIHEIKAALTEQVGHTASLGEWMSKSRLYASIFSGLQIKKCVFHGYFTMPTSQVLLPPSICGRQYTWEAGMRSMN